MTTMQVAPPPHPAGWGRRLLHWTPRVLGMLFAVFVSIFALDVFGAGYTFVELLVAFTMHMLPTFALVAVLALAWRWPWVGGVGFLGFAAWYVATFRGFDWSVYVLLAGVPALIGVLFVGDWVARRWVARDGTGN